jgi:hypothetical protein
MEDMDKKRRASSEASPRPSKQRSLVNETFASVRNNGVLVTMICSFLPVKDRVQLGQVDKEFYADERRGQIVGIYGEYCFDIEKALEEVRNYVKLEHSLDSMVAMATLPLAALGTTSQNANCCVGGQGSWSRAGSTRSWDGTSKPFESTRILEKSRNSPWKGWHL